MPNEALSLIINLLFYIVVGAFILLAILGMYIVLKYGSSKAVALLASLIFAVVFGAVLISAYITLQLIV